MPELSAQVKGCSFRIKLSTSYEVEMGVQILFNMERHSTPPRLGFRGGAGGGGSPPAAHEFTIYHHAIERNTGRLNFYF